MGPDVWSTPGWRADATDWLDTQLARVGVDRIGALEQRHLRAWAVVLSAPTTRGLVWLKAVGAGTAFEPRLYELLRQVSPEPVLAPLAIDVERGWILLPDGGRVLAESLAGDELLDTFAKALVAYGRLQRELASHVETLLAIGVADMRPEAMVGRFDEALAAVAPYATRHASAADREAYERLPGLRPTFAGWCRTLATAPGPASLDHNDLHTWNVLLGGDGAREVKFYDWGDAVVAHPFATMLVPLGFAQKQILDCELDDPRLLRLRDGYLDVFADLAPHAELVAALELACRVGKVARALTWSRALQANGDGPPGRHAEAPLRSLASLFDDSHLGEV